MSPSSFPFVFSGLFFELLAICRKIALFVNNKVVTSRSIIDTTGELDLLKICEAL